MKTDANCSAPASLPWTPRLLREAQFSHTVRLPRLFPLSPHQDPEGLQVRQWLVELLMGQPWRNGVVQLSTLRLVAAWRWYGVANTRERWPVRDFVDGDLCRVLNDPNVGLIVEPVNPVTLSDVG